ncbi:BON domain-containing protein [Desulforhabdus sp. TSK]|uniref:BON domain-containing protein n=1 Tax=Desulforhabdus sp. TSK TaxID=2925014 RepID=UPI001FC890E8|nr:BON domain-containing protein [Desulforhabdus sp. TSK]GKT09137.1 hypothetical protein DSTSK_24420 [Desulforhabdus sp. TSK]
MEDFVGWLIGAVFVIFIVGAILKYMYFTIVLISANILTAADKMLGAWSMFPPVVSWALMGFLLGSLLYFAFIEANRLNRPGLKESVIGACAVIVLLCPLMGPWINDGLQSLSRQPTPVEATPQLTPKAKNAGQLPPAETTPVNSTPQTVVQPVAVPITPAVSRQSAAQLYERGMELFAGNDFSAAAPLLEDSIKAGLSGERLGKCYLKLLRIFRELKDANKYAYYSIKRRDFSDSAFTHAYVKLFCDVYTEDGHDTKDIVFEIPNMVKGPWDRSTMGEFSGYTVRSGNVRITFDKLGYQTGKIEFPAKPGEIVTVINQTVILKKDKKTTEIASSKNAHEELRQIEDQRDMQYGTPQTRASQPAVQPPNPIHSPVHTRDVSVISPAAPSRQELKTRIERELEKKDIFSVSVYVQEGGIVNLSGVVASSREIERVRGIVTKVPGVIRIKSYLSARTAPPPPPRRAVTTDSSQSTFHPAIRPQSER